MASWKMMKENPMTSRKIAAILREAADYRLMDSGEDPRPLADWWTCRFAVLEQGDTLYTWQAWRFLQALGHPEEARGGFESEFTHPPVRQGARFLFLHFAACVAEDWDEYGQPLEGANE
jgi:hypothetical protein